MAKELSGAGGGSSAPLPYGPQLLSYNPSLWWKLDESSGTTAADSSGNGNDGTYSGTGITYGVSGPIAGETAVTLDGIAGAVTSAYVQTSTVAVTVITWFKTLPSSWVPSLVATDAPQSSGAGLAMWLGTLGGTGVLWQPYCDYSALIAGGQYQATYGVAPPNDTNWHMLAMTCSSVALQGEVAYLDGLPVGGNNSRSPVALTPSSNTLQVGKPYGVASYFAGSVAQVALWDGVALSATQIANLWAVA